MVPPTRTGNVPSHDNYTVKPSAVASYIVSTSKAPEDREHTTQVKREFEHLKASTDLQSEYSRNFSHADITKALEDVKPDLTAAYEIVWKQGLLYKLLRLIPCKTTVRVIYNMLGNRLFRVVMGNSMSNWKKLNNGLPQGSVSAPLLFSCYIADMTTTKSRKSGYADDWAIATRRNGGNAYR
ncbi:hypothetical protein JTB14_032553 [Gonioctena quinquepunctata]|nr:hypothetical protein JTB14_032553 [Gonioctena quinquepunctata]